MSYGYIYKTTNLINDKLYIGQHKGKFDYDYFGSGVYLNNSLKKHGKNNFKLEIIIYAKDKQKLDELEKQYIKEYREKFGKYNLYNITDGGEGHTGPFSIEHIENLRLSHIGIKDSQQTIEKKRLAKLGKKNSAEHCRNIGLSKQGTHHSQEAKQKNRLAHLGKKYSEETQEKKCLAMKLYWANKKEN